MATIPTFTRQTALPKTTGTPSAPVVPIQNQVGQALGGFGQDLSKIGDDLFKAHSVAEINQSTINAQLKLNSLETELAKTDGMEALGSFQDRAAKIYEESSAGMSPAVRDAFDQKWVQLSANSQIKIQGTATKRAYSKLRGDLTIGLNSLSRGLTQEGKAIAGDQALFTGLEYIEQSIATNVITAKEGAKIALDFRKKTAENSVRKWMRSQGADNNFGYKQLKSGIFDFDENNPLIGDMYDLLDDTKKDSLIRNALTKASALERANRTKESDVVKAQLIKGKKALLKIFNSKTPKKEKQEILSELAGNPQVPVSDFRAAQKAVEGVSKDFDKPEDVTDLRKKIWLTPESVTMSHILESDLSQETVRTMLVLLESRKDKNLARAKELIRQHPAFMPKNEGDKRRNGEGYNLQQAETFSKVIELKMQAEAKNEPFDIFKTAQDLIKNIEQENQDPVNTQNAKSSLLEINPNFISKAAVQSYLDIGEGKNLTLHEQDKLHSLARKAFPNE